MLQSMWSQRVKHDRATEHQRGELLVQLKTQNIYETTGGQRGKTIYKIIS